jgi:excisionase family DNA binding protein
MTVTEAARALNCSARLVYRLCQANELTYRRVGFGRGRIDIAPRHVAEYLERVEVPAVERRDNLPPARVRLRAVRVPDAFDRMYRERETGKGKR